MAHLALSCIKKKKKKEKKGIAVNPEKKFCISKESEFSFETDNYITFPILALLFVVHQD